MEQFMALHVMIPLNISAGMVYTTPKQQMNGLLTKFSLVPSLIHQFHLGRHVN